MIIEGILVTIVLLFGLPFLAGGMLWILGVGGRLLERFRAFVEALQSQHWVETTGRITRSVVTYTSSRSKLCCEVGAGDQLMRFCTKQSACSGRVLP